MIYTFESLEQSEANFNMKNVFGMMPSQIRNERKSFEEIQNVRRKIIAARKKLQLKFM